MDFATIEAMRRHEASYLVKKAIYEGNPDEIDRLYTTSPTKEILEQLNIIRESYRNPTQHPEKIYNIGEAQVLFGLCMHAVEIMVADPKYARSK